MEVTGDLAMAWMLLWRATLAAKALAGKPKKKDIPFYEGQLNGARFFIYTLLPTALGKMNGIMTLDDAVVSISEDGLGGK